MEALEGMRLNKNPTTSPQKNSLHTLKDNQAYKKDFKSITGKEFSSHHETGY